MFTKNFKNFISNFALVIFSIFIGLLIINYSLIFITPQKLLPRPLAGSLPNSLLTFYPDTYNKKDLNQYVAILGDSYAQGGGDAYLNGTEDYSIAHHLHKNDKKNYLLFARAGYGSISAVSNLIKIYNLSNRTFSIKDLNKPKEIYFFFYEGNDLRDNIVEYNRFSKSDESIKDYISRRIDSNLQLDNLDKLKNSFPIIPFVGEFLIDIKDLFSQIFSKNGIKQIKPLVVSRIKKLLGHTIILGDASINEVTWTNSLKNHKSVKNIRPIQGAAIHLTQKEISISLQIFFESIKYIKSWAKTNKVNIIYLPSPISTYDWNEPITFYYQDYEKGIKFVSNNKNEKNSIFIREQIKNFSINNNLVFFDTTNYLFEKGSDVTLHGPLDWGHFNYEGYKNIAKYIIEKRSNN